MAMTASRTKRAQAGASAPRRATLIERSSGDVFRDLGFAEPEAAHLRLRAELALRVRAFVEGRALTQAAAARAMGVTQPRLNAILRGRLDEFSLDSLVLMLARAGESVELRQRRSAARRAA